MTNNIVTDSYRFVRRINSETVLLVSQDGNVEMFSMRTSGHSGWTVEVDGIPYEFVRTATAKDKFDSTLVDEIGVEEVYRER